jgi:tetratricopeptide (TPR) repeat protein
VGAVFPYSWQWDRILRPLLVSGDLGSGAAALILQSVIGSRILQSTVLTGIPPRRNAGASVGQSAALLELHAGLQQSPIVAIIGKPNLAGIGKTELAIQYAQHYAAAYPGGIFWLEGLATLQNHQPPPDSLLILEDVVEVHSLKSYLAAGDSLRVIVTVGVGADTGALLAMMPAVMLDLWTRTEALEFLAQRVRDSRFLSMGNQEFAALIGEWLGYLPLGLDLVAQYLLGQPELSLTDFLQQLQPKWLNQPVVPGDPLTVNAQRGLRAALELSYEHLSREAQTLGSLLSLLAAAPIPWDLVEQILYPFAQAAWLDVMQVDFCHGKWTGAEQDWQEFLAHMQAMWLPARKELARSHLIIELESNQVRCHPVVREFFQEKLHYQPDAALYPQAVTQTLVALAHGNNGTDLTALLPHWIEISHTLVEFLSSADQICIWLKLAEVYEQADDWELAALWQHKALDLLQRRLGQSSPPSAIAMNAVSSFPTVKPPPFGGPSNHSPQTQNQAQTQSQNTVAVNTAPDTKGSNSVGAPPLSPPLVPPPISLHPSETGSAGPEPSVAGNGSAPAAAGTERLWHAISAEADLELAPPSSLDTLTERATRYFAEGRYAAAEPLCQQAIELIQQQMGPDHPAVAKAWSDLAMVYAAQRHYDKAEALYLEALELRYSTYGESHPEVAASLHDLGDLYAAQSLWEEAEPLYIKALEMQQRLLEDFHPDVVKSLTDLAHLYEAQQRYNVAEPLYQQALTLLKRRSGSQHPDVATGLNNLAYLYESQLIYDKAEALYQQALDLRQRLLGPEHPDVATSLNNLAAVSTAQGKYRRAEQLYTQALEISDRTLGPDHPNTIIFRENLQIFRREQRSRQSEPEGILSRIFGR